MTTGNAQEGSITLDMPLRSSLYLHPFKRYSKKLRVDNFWTNFDDVLTILQLKSCLNGCDSENILKTHLNARFHEERDARGLKS